MDKLIFDVGASNIKFALMSNNGEIIQRNKIPTPKDNLENFLKAFIDLSKDYLDRVDAIGVSTNGRMLPDGNTYRAYTMNFLTGINIKEKLEELFHLPVIIENDGYAAAIGEWWKGAGKGSNTVLCIVLGSAMGGGLIVDGKPWRGANRNGAMVFGQLTSAAPNKEKYIISGMETSFMLYLAIAEKLNFMQANQMTGEKFFELLEKGDIIVKTMFKRFCNAIAVTIYNNALLLDPDKVIITGGLAERDVLIEGITQALQKISQKGLVFKGIDLKKNDFVFLDINDFNVKCIRGNLCLDANLYGALYCVLNEL